METEKPQITPLKFICEKCTFKCCNKKDYLRHISTAKHTKEMPGNKKPHYGCAECKKNFKTNSGLWKHNRTCVFRKQEKIESKPPENIVIETEEINKRDELIDCLVKELLDARNEKKEMKSMFQLMIEKYQEIQIQNQEMQMQNQENTKEIVNKVMEMIPQMGTTTNNTHIEKQTLKFYLSNTCKDAESIHEFTDRFVNRIEDFYHENYRAIAENQVNLASKVYDTFIRCLEDNPQTKNFIQTTDIKNGVLYVKEKSKDANRKLYGDAAFVKYIDGFEKAGINISQAIRQRFIPLQVKYQTLLTDTHCQKPSKDDADDVEDDEYERRLDRYKSKTSDMRNNLCFQTCHAINIFDNKTNCATILSKTKTKQNES